MAKFVSDRVQGFFEELLDAAPDAMVIVDGAGRIELVNAQTQNLLGYRAEELVGQPVEMLIPQRFREAHPHHRDEYYANPRTRPMGAGMALFALHKDGREIPVEISLSPLQTDAGLLVIGAIRDVTAQRRAEAQIKELNERLARRARQLEATNSELEAFSYSVSRRCWKTTGKRWTSRGRIFCGAFGRRRRAWANSSTICSGYRALRGRK